MTDCISRSDVHDLIATWLSDHLTEGTREVLETIDGKIEDLPEVEPTRVKGHWIEHEKVFECSECHIIRAKGTTGKYNYCPNCGSYNGGEEDADRN